MTELTDRLQVRLTDDETAQWLADRCQRMRNPSVHVQARDELWMWRTMLARELGRIRLSLAQASCIADVMNGHLMQPRVSLAVGIVYAECYDAFRLARETPLPEESSYGAKWEISEQELLDYLGSLGPVADHALEDAIQRWWKQAEPVAAEGFAKVGLKMAAT